MARIPTGRNPRQVALSPDGRTLCVAERLQDTVLAVDTGDPPADRAGRPRGRRRQTTRSGAGRGVFARASTTFQGQFSCRSCHPDGHVDGLSYDFDIDGVGRDILDNRSLQGLAGTEPFKWNGKNPSLRVQCGPRFAKVLTRADPFGEKDLDDLDAFIFSLPPTPDDVRPDRGRTPRSGDASSSSPRRRRTAARFHAVCAAPPATARRSTRTACPPTSGREGRPTTRVSSTRRTSSGSPPRPRTFTTGGPRRSRRSGRSTTRRTSTASRTT